MNKSALDKLDEIEPNRTNGKFSSHLCVKLMYPCRNRNFRSELELLDDLDLDEALRLDAVLPHGTR